MNWQELDLKRTSGQEKTTCPACSPERKKKNDRCFSVNHEGGVGHCWHCGEIAFREPLQKKKREYDLPSQEWTNHTRLSDKVVKYFSGRGISQQTLIDCRITEESHYQPQLGKEVNNIVFNYFEGRTLVNKKYRSANKAFTQEKNAKKIFYGLNDIIGERECYIVEGEIDKLSLWEAGKKNCISVPNGASDSSVFEDCEEYLKGIEKFYIAVDMDEKGIQLEKELLKRLGKHKCYRIKFKGKDANEDLVSNKLELIETLDNKIEYPIDGTYTAFDIRDELFELFDNGFDEVVKPSDRFLRPINEIFGQLPGQLTIVTGIPGHGKSNFVEWYVLNLVHDLGYKASLYSPEHFPMKHHHRTLAEKVIGKSFIGRDSMSKEELNRYIEWSKDKIYLTIPEKAIIPDWDWLFEKFEEQIYRYGIDVFVIDAFNKVKMRNGTLFEINEVLARLTLFCQMHNVNVFLVSHPTKMKKEEGKEKYMVPSLYDVKGSGDFYDQAHNGWTVYREYDTDFEEGYIRVIITKSKFRHQRSEVGKEALFSFDLKTGRFIPRLGPSDTGYLFKEKQQADMKQLIDDLYNEEETPF